MRRTLPGVACALAGAAILAVTCLRGGPPPVHDDTPPPKTRRVEVQVDCPSREAARRFAEGPLIEMLADPWAQHAPVDCLTMVRLGLEGLVLPADRYDEILEAYARGLRRKLPSYLYLRSPELKVVHHDGRQCWAVVRHRGYEGPEFTALRLEQVDDAVCVADFRRYGTLDLMSRALRRLHVGQLAAWQPAGKGLTDYDRGWLAVQCDQAGQSYDPFFLSTVEQLYALPEPLAKDPHFVARAVEAAAWIGEKAAFEKLYDAARGACPDDPSVAYALVAACRRRGPARRFGEAVDLLERHVGPDRLLREEHLQLAAREGDYGEALKAWRRLAAGSGRLSWGLLADPDVQRFFESDAFRDR